MAEFVLKNNYFEFNGKVKKQISETAIGNKFKLPYACIFMDQVQTEVFKTRKHKSLVWFRYIDDVLFIWTHGKETLSLFWKDLNNFHLSIKLCHVVNKESIHFLDPIFDCQMVTFPQICMLNLQTDTNFSTLHRLIQIIRSIVFSQVLIFSRICSEKSDFLKHLEKMESWFSVRWYPEDLIESEMKKGKFSSNNRNAKRGNSFKVVPFVMAYHP